MSSVVSTSEPEPKPETGEAVSCPGPGKDETEAYFSKVLPEETEPYLALECIGMGKKDETERSSLTFRSERSANLLSSIRDADAPAEEDAAEPYFSSILSALASACRLSELLPAPKCVREAPSAPLADVYTLPSALSILVGL